MKLTRIKFTAVWVIPLLIVALWSSPVLGEDVDVSYKIVSFYEDVTWKEILAYAEKHHPDYLEPCGDWDDGFPIGTWEAYAREIPPESGD